MQSAQFQLHAQIEERHWWFVARRRILADVIDAVLPHTSPPSTIVDVGCGTGANLASLAGRYECVGIDTSVDAVRLAHQRFPGVRFIHGLAPDDLGPIMDRARLILLCDVLEHVPDDFALFSELLAVARPGTYFLITVPADRTLWSRHDRAFGHYRRYDRERLEMIWRGLAVEPIFVSHFNARLYPLVKTVRHWNRAADRSAGEAGTDFRMPGRLLNGLLSCCFAGERRRLARLARGEPASPYRRGVSLMALVRRQQGLVEPRHKPSYVPCDEIDATADWELAAAAR